MASCLQLDAAGCSWWFLPNKFEVDRCSMVFLCFPHSAMVHKSSQGFTLAQPHPTTASSNMLKSLKSLLSSSACCRCSNRSQKYESHEISTKTYNSITTYYNDLQRHFFLGLRNCWVHRLHSVVFGVLCRRRWLAFGLLDVEFKRQENWRSADRSKGKSSVAHHHGKNRKLW